MQDKRRGGISLQDVKTKIQALRLKFIGNIVSNPQNFPLSHYYIGTHISKLIKVDNRSPHFIGQLSPFYKQCIDCLKDNANLINLPTKDIYRKLVLAQEPPLQLRIKIGHKYFITDYISIFNNLHDTQITPKTREITYRLLFNMTPVTQKVAKKFNKLYNCKICRQNIQETEQHIFYSCHTIQLALAALKETIAKNTTEKVDMYKIIMSNILPNTDKYIRLQLLRVLAEFRALVWDCRNRAVYEHRIYSDGLFLKLFESKIQNIEI
jgi:hypothetical protein